MCFPIMHIVLKFQIVIFIFTMVKLQKNSPHTAMKKCTFNSQTIATNEFDSMIKNGMILLLIQMNLSHGYSS